MAILSECPGLNVRIRINGILANEYKDPATLIEPGRNVCYIETQPGKPFAVSLIIAHEIAQRIPQTIALHVYVDGVRTNRRTYHPTKLDSYDPIYEEIEEAEDINADGHQTKRAFSFEHLEIGKHLNASCWQMFRLIKQMRMIPSTYLTMPKKQCEKWERS
jgi:hypothetical protein